jgi:hypothetical protein
VFPGRWRGQYLANSLPLPPTDTGTAEAQVQTLHKSTKVRYRKGIEKSHWLEKSLPIVNINRSAEIPPEGLF